MTERRNYLLLAHSKLRQCGVGPMLNTGALPAHLEGTSRIRRDGAVLWQKPFLTGEANMCHTFANLEYHHFKYKQHRVPGDVHLHFFGTATVSFVDNIRDAGGRRVRSRPAGAGRTARQQTADRAGRPRTARDRDALKRSQGEYDENFRRRALLAFPWPRSLLASCAREKPDERIVLGFSQIGAESEWRTANTESIKAAAATMNIDLRFADAQQKQENQIKALRSIHRAEGGRDRVLSRGRHRLGHGASWKPRPRGFR